MKRRPHGQAREEVFAFVRDRIREGFPPTVREVQRALGFRAVESARAHLTALVAEGRLVKEPGKSRGYRLPPSTPAVQAAPASPSRRDPVVRLPSLSFSIPWKERPAPFLVPLLGRVQAGALTTAVEDPEGWVPVHARWPRETLFALRVRGESMRDAGILPGDIVIVHQQPTARSGEVVVALVEDEATVKTLRIRGRRVELHPANPAFDPIVPEPDALRILGRVIEVRRDLTQSSPLP